MAVKLFGSVLIITGILGIGMTMAFKEKFRLDSLCELRKSINMLMSQLLYSREMLYDALVKIKESSTEMKNVYNEILKGMDNNNSASLSWKLAFEKYKNDLYMDKSEIDNISNFARIFSSSDYDYQKSEMNEMLSYLDDKIAASNEKWHKDMKLYKSISLSAAAFVVILLF